MNKKQIEQLEAMNAEAKSVAGGIKESFNNLSHYLKVAREYGEYKKRQAYHMNEEEWNEWFFNGEQEIKNNIMASTILNSLIALLDKRDKKVQAGKVESLFDLYKTFSAWVSNEMKWRNEVKDYELTAVECLTLSPDDYDKYKTAIRCCHNEWANGPFGGWVRGHKMLEELGWKKTEKKGEHRIYITLTKPERFRKGEDE